MRRRRERMELCWIGTGEPMELRRAHYPTRAVAAANGGGAPSARVQRACAHLCANYARPIALRELATAAGLSTCHFIRVFRQEVGLAPYAYLELVRVEAAKRLLRAGAPVSQVAYATGFSDQSHLTRMFKRIVGVTPGRYVRG